MLAQVLRTLVSTFDCLGWNEECGGFTSYVAKDEDDEVSEILSNVDGYMDD